MNACINCKNLSLKSNTEHAKLGWGRCKVKPSATFVFVGRDMPCDTFKQEADEKIKPRIEWWNKRGNK